MDSQLIGQLRDAVEGDSDRALLRVTARYQPAAGPGGKVFPPTYPADRDGNAYVREDRVVDGIVRPAVQLDSVPSQANRAEEAILAAHRSGRVTVPMMELRHEGDGPLVLSSLEFPHRYADAYARDSLIDGTSFDRSAVGQEILASSLEEATGLFTYDPGSLVYGAWNSHRKGRQQKFARAYSSEVVGWDPAFGARRAGRMDPVNLTGAAKPGKGEESWDFLAVGEKVKGERLSEIGHGNIAPNPTHGGVTISSATRLATLSTAVLNRLRFGTAPHAAQVAARVTLAGYALMADRLAFAGPSLWLRSGCELVLVDEQVEWVFRGGATEAIQVSPLEAVEAFVAARQAAADAGLPMATDTVILTPNTALAKAIDFALTKAEQAD